MASLAGLPIAERVRNALTSYGLYLVLTVWPVNLSVFYPYNYAGFGVAGALLALSCWLG